MKNVGENTKLETALPVYHLTHVSSRYKIKSGSFFFRLLSNHLNSYLPSFAKRKYFNGLRVFSWIL